MQHVHLIHNNTAGEGHAKEEMINLILSQGYKCHYASAKEMGWDQWPANTDFVAIAGGDGTVRQVVTKLMELVKPLPFALLPAGTANNVSKTLGLEGSKEDIVEGWKNGHLEKIDIGKISRHEQAKYFIESMGFGIFPQFVEAMKHVSEGDSPEENLRNSVLAFHKIAMTYEPQSCQLMIDGTDYSGSYLLVEIMNIKYIGPNVRLSPDSNPKDGFLEIILVKENNRDILLDYLSSKIEGNEGDCKLPVIKAKKVAILWPRNIAHVDDTIIDLQPQQQLTVEIVPGPLEYLQPSR